MYKPGITYTRTPEEKQDMFLAWQRPDKAFFAAGACHILGFLFVSLHMHEGYKLIHIKPKGKNASGHHMFASNGTWAFDFNGWTKETELLGEYAKAYIEKYPGWEYERVAVPYDWEGFGKYLLETHHRPPEYFPHLPWERAYTYIQQFPSQPPMVKSRRVDNKG